MIYQGVVKADSRHCQTTKHCNDKCFRISKIRSIS